MRSTPPLLWLFDFLNFVSVVASALCLWNGLKTGHINWKTFLARLKFFLVWNCIPYHTILIIRFTVMNAVELPPNGPDPGPVTSAFLFLLSYTLPHYNIASGTMCASFYFSNVAFSLINSIAPSLVNGWARKFYQSERFFWSSMAFLVAMVVLSVIIDPFSDMPMYWTYIFILVFNFIAVSYTGILAVRVLMRFNRLNRAAVSKMDSKAPVASSEKPIVANSASSAAAAKESATANSNSMNNKETSQALVKIIIYSIFSSLVLLSTIQTEYGFFGPYGLSYVVRLNDQPFVPLPFYFSLCFVGSFAAYLFWKPAKHSNKNANAQQSATSSQTGNVGNTSSVNQKLIPVKSGGASPLQKNVVQSAPMSATEDK